MEALDWRSVHDGLAVALAARGLELTHAFSLRSIDGLFAHSSPDALAILVGNTRSLWKALEAETLEVADPVNHYVESALLSSLDEANAPPHQVYWTHSRYDGSYLPFQRIAHAAGFAHLSPSLLLIHREHGPWFALRAMIVFELLGPEAQPAPDPCSHCLQPCLPALAAAERSDEWRAWLAVRDACPEGIASRYGEVQIRYHYTKDRSLLKGSR